MQHRAIIKIVNLQSDLGSEPETVAYRGICGQSGDKFLVRYRMDFPEDGQADGDVAAPGGQTGGVKEGSSSGDPTTCTVKFTEKTAEVTRTTTDGTLLSHMYFAEGEQSVSVYRAAEMPLELLIHTHRLRSEIYDGGAFLELSYDLDINGQRISTCELKMEISYEQ